MVTHGVNSAPATGILLVEGVDDKHVVWHLCGCNKVLFSVSRSDYGLSVTLPGQSTTFEIFEKGNRSELLKTVGVMATTRQFRSIGVLLDADRNLQKCWDEVVKGFSRTSIQLPATPNPMGTIIPEQVGQPRIGIWLMPGNTSPGEVEDFVMKMMPVNDVVWPIADSYISSIPTPAQQFEQVKTDKAKLYAWLATRREPSRMGAAIGNLDLEVNGALCQDFLTWLSDVFG